MEDTLHLLAVIRTRPDQVDQMRSLLEGLIPPTRREPGCIRYSLMQDREDPTRFVFVEEWASEEALSDHFETEHMTSNKGRFEELSAEPLELIRLHHIG